MTINRKCVTADCQKMAQHRSGCCRTCERDRLGEPLYPRQQACTKCGRQAYKPLCTACVTGQTDVALRQKADEEKAAADLRQRPQAGAVLYERRIGHQVFDVVFDGSVR